MGISLKHRALTRKIIRAFYDVYNELGTGFVESVYENALYLLLNEIGLKTEKQPSIPVYFRNNLVGEFRADLIVEEKIILELKALSGIKPIYEAQLLNYLKATKKELGLLLNFGDKPEFRRMIFNKK